MGNVKVGDYIKWKNTNDEKFVRSFISSDTARYKLVPNTFKVSEVYEDQKELIIEYYYTDARNANPTRQIRGSVGIYRADNISYSEKDTLAYEPAAPYVPRTEKPLVTLKFDYSINRKMWNDQLEKEMIKKLKASAETTVRRTQREWPFGKTLVHEVDYEKDEIKFYWGTEHGAEK